MNPDRHDDDLSRLFGVSTACRARQPPSIPPGILTRKRLIPQLRNQPFQPFRKQVLLGGDRTEMGVSNAVVNFHSVPESSSNVAKPREIRIGRAPQAILQLFMVKRISPMRRHAPLQWFA
jgi:hypothetical protein